MFINNINYPETMLKTQFETHPNTKKKEFNEIFIDCIKTGLGKISNIQNHAKADAEKFILNQPGISLNDVMINLEKSSISIQMAIQIRNKIVSAYEEIMNQQI
ncbi:flagellar hook-basal body complex protein FliE [Buchnera aphidicola (Macrosiphoniella sanborni)]|uniref:Flagellar hook-basal body complex protein FliE n=1 Tax=Buchnera aphidicola (Macrosiphoniella sanborni) TaxID=1241865 RepID=A0A4D6Y3Q0_9GAMM|nr:flagellar hook-basal body complex protein FliE [Buchnera aphidicola]QCI23639.1 flagellar hook-basal body complex protein FliE [Buchnera aphidicola (Macrosiphoniella sanborni)]